MVSECVSLYNMIGGAVAWVYQFTQYDWRCGGGCQFTQYDWKCSGRCVSLHNAVGGAVVGVSVYTI